MRLGHGSISMPETVCQKPVQKDTWARLHAAQTELFYLYGPSEVNDRLYDDSGVDIGKRSSSQGRKTTRGGGECDDSHSSVINNHYASLQWAFLVAFAFVLYAMHVSPAATVKLQQ